MEWCHYQNAKLWPGTGYSNNNGKFHQLPTAYIIITMSSSLDDFPETKTSCAQFAFTFLQSKCVCVRLNTGFARRKTLRFKCQRRESIERVVYYDGKRASFKVLACNRMQVASCNISNHIHTHTHEKMFTERLCIVDFFFFSVCFHWRPPFQFTQYTVKCLCDTSPCSLCCWFFCLLSILDSNRLFGTYLFGKCCS